MRLKYLILIALVIGSLFAAAQSTTAPCNSTVVGNLKFHRLESKIFNNTRMIRVLLPAGYDDPANKERKYPVLYLLDGQNLFDVCSNTFNHKEWRVDETAAQLIKEKKIPPIIIVGIDHAGSDRAVEFLPYKDFAGYPKMPEPQGKKFPDFLTSEVMPLVEQNYRVLKGHGNTGIGGSSYGGVASLYALMAKPDVFGYGLIESPVLWIGMGQLVRDTNPFIALPRKVFIGFGGKEADNPMISEKFLSLVRMLDANLKSAGYNDSNLKVVIDPEADHSEESWGKRLPSALTFLFGEWTSVAAPEQKN